jgi:hypothetical protein
MATDPLVLGVHLEGPFLSPHNKGAHNESFLIDPTPAAVDALLEAGEGVIRQVTIAPELPGALDAVGRFVDAGVTVAVGHTVGTYDQARAAFDAGATILTHACNAMPGLHHRAPGPIGAAVADDRVTLELILDAVHVHPVVAETLFRATPGRVALITDAMGAAGAADGSYRLGSLDVTVTDGVAHVAGTDTIAGSTLTQDVALRNAVSLAGRTLPEAVAALTSVPAAALGIGAGVHRGPRGAVAVARGAARVGRGARAALKRAARVQRSTGRPRSPLAHDVSAVSPTRSDSVPPRVTKDAGTHDRSSVRPFNRAPCTYGSVPFDRMTIRSPLARRMSTVLNVGLPMSMSARPGVCGNRPIEAKTYQALIVPRSSLPGRPPGPVE